MAFFDADKATNNSRLDELKIFTKKTQNSQKKGVLYFSKGDVTIEVYAVVKNKNGEEKGKINGLVAKNGDDEPIWDITDMKYDFKKFFVRIDKGKLDKVISEIFKGKDTIWGSHFNDKLFGFDGNDTIKGWRGDDKLNGGKGKDLLIGSIGKDTFVFDQKLKYGNKDTIDDFRGRDDKIELKKKIFSNLDKGTLSDDDFTIGRDAVGDHAQIIYRSQKGTLLYDPDGAGGKDPLVFADIGKNKNLDHDYFFVS